MPIRIEKYKKKNNSLYEITLSNKEKMTLYDDVILKYELLLKKEIDDKLYDVLLKEQEKEKAYHKAIKYLSTKMRTKSELKKHLKDFDLSTIKYVIDRIDKEGYINNANYIKAYINDSINLKAEGQNKIIRDLKKLGFNESEIPDYLNTIESSIWLTKIEKLINKKINSNHNLSGYVLKNKIYSDLINKGFISSDINSIIDSFEFNDDIDIYNKEKEKITKKLSKKYSGEELEYRINIELRKKGFQ